MNNNDQHLQELLARVRRATERAEQGDITPLRYVVTVDAAVELYRLAKDLED